MRGLSLVVASGGHSSLQCVGLSPSRPLLLQSTGPRRAGSVIVAHGPSCSTACGIFPDPASNPCALHWQADSQPLRHQGSPHKYLIFICHLLCSQFEGRVSGILSKVLMADHGIYWVPPLYDKPCWVLSGKQIITPVEDFPGGAVVKNLPANSGNTGSSPGPGRYHMLWSS